MRAKFVSSTFLLLLAGASVFMAAPASANSGTSVSVSDKSCPTAGCTLVGDSFEFSLTPGPQSVPPGGFAFTNNTNTTWHSLKITEVGYLPASVTCLSSAFEKCTITDSKNSVTVVLSGIGGQYTGVGPGQSFRINMGCPHCGPNKTIEFMATANVSEPDTFGLMGTGMLLVGAAFVRRRYHV